MRMQLFAYVSSSPVLWICVCVFVLSVARANFIRISGSFSCSSYYLLNLTTTKKERKKTCLDEMVARGAHFVWHLRFHSREIILTMAPDFFYNHCVCACVQKDHYIIIVFWILEQLL